MKLKDTADKIYHWSHRVTKQKKLNLLKDAEPHEDRCETCLNYKTFVVFDFWIEIMKNFNARKVKKQVSSSEEDSE